MDAFVVMDASVWIGRLRPQDVSYEHSRLWVERYTIAGGFLIAPTFLLIEVAAAISRRTGEIALARKAIEELQSTDTIRFVPMDLPLVQSAVDMAMNLQLRAGDATYLAVAHQLGIPLVSWDKEQLERGSSITTTYTPSNYVF